MLVWYLIALQTMVEPSFYQRVFAARSPGVARSGVVISVAMWAVFDFFSIGCGLAARALLPDDQGRSAARDALAAAAQLLEQIEKLKRVDLKIEEEKQKILQQNEIIEENSNGENSGS